MNQLIVHIVQWIIAIPFIGFILGFVFFIILFLPISEIVWWYRFNAVSKVARQENVEWKYFCTPIEGYERAFFPDRLIKPGDSSQMIQIKKKFINHVKLVWKVLIWWGVLEVFFLLAAVAVLALSH